MPQNMASKGGGRGHQKIALKFGSDSICNNANISARMQKNSVTKVLRTQIFPISPYFIIHSTATLPHQLFRTLLVYS